MGMERFTWGLLLALALTALGCASEGADAPVEPDTVELDGPGEGAERPGFCARQDVGTDPIREYFCDGPVRTLGSLRELQIALGFFSPPPSEASQQFPLLLGHSTALAGHRVSSINPRLIAIGVRNVLAFQRGVQQVELIGRTTAPRAYVLYLLRFRQRCNDRAEGCAPGELYTARIESDWTGYDIRDDEELKNDPADCRQCHQRARETPQLLMRERIAPWTHFFDPPRAEGDRRTLPGVLGSDLMEDYRAAWGDEPYAGVEPSALPPNGGAILDRASGINQQPLVFDSLTIQNERWPRMDGAFAETPQPSPTWERAFEAFKRGEQLALPYLEPRVADPSKLAKATEAYTAYRAGELDGMELPDLADIFPDDPNVRARMGLETELSAGPVDALIQACASCHNDVLDQTISRARFNVNVSRLDEAALARAIERLQRSTNERGAMPPREARQLTADARERLIRFLRTEARSGKPIEALTRAAELGMRGGAL